MAQAAGNSCLVCNSLIRSKRRQRNILESSSMETGSTLTIRARVETILNLPVEDCGSNFICDKCYTDLEQIEQYYNLVECFRQRYIIAVQARKKGRGAKGQAYRQDVSIQAPVVSTNTCEYHDHSDQASDSRQDTDSQRYDSESVGVGSESVGAESERDHSDAEYQTEIFTESEVPAYEVVVGGDDDAINSESCESDYGTSREVPAQVSEAESEVPLPEKKPAKKKKMQTCQICGVTLSKKKMKVHMKMHADDEPFASAQVTARMEFNGTVATIETDASNGYVQTSSQRFPCKECGKTFSSRHKLLRHTAYHIGRKPYICVICDKKFTWSWHLQRHVKTHSYILPFTCCNKVYCVTSELTQHMLVHKDTPTMDCGLCTEMFSTKVQLKQHRLLIHGKTSTEAVACNICGKSYKKSHKLKAHMASAHPTSTTNTSTASSSSTATTEVSNVNRCSYCSQIFKTITTLQTHIKKHTENKCTVCGKEYSQATSLRIHMMTHRSGGSADLCKCSHCGKEFGDMYTLKRHMNTHGPEKTHACTECGKSFMRKDHLTKHMTIHSGVKPHVCGTCGKAFGRLDKMKSHMAIHLRAEIEKSQVTPVTGANTTSTTTTVKANKPKSGSVPKTIVTNAIKVSTKKKKKEGKKSAKTHYVQEPSNGLYAASSPDYDSKSAQSE